MVVVFLVWNAVAVVVNVPVANIVDLVDVILVVVASKICFAVSKQIFTSCIFIAVSRISS